MKPIYKSIMSITLVALIVFLGIKTVPEALNYRDKAEVITEFMVNEPVQPDLQSYQLIMSVPAKGVLVYGKRLDSKPYFQQILVKTPTAQRELIGKALRKIQGLYLQMLLEVDRRI
jgi:hypothetical protein